VDVASWLEWWTAERVVALATAGQLAVLLIAAWYARRQVAEARELRKAEARRREAEARPYVVVDFEPEVPPLLYLVVTNLGRTMASNVRFEVDPPFRSTQDEHWGLPVGQIRLLTSGIPSLAPGKRHVTAFDTLFDREKLGLPSCYRVRVFYDGEDGQSFTDTQRLDLDLYRDLRPVRRDTIHEVSETLKQIERRMTGWSSRLDRLLFRTPDEVQRRHEGIEAGLAEQSEPNSHAAGNGRARLAGQLVEAVGRLRRRR
jgi:hypothetical protein